MKTIKKIILVFIAVFSIGVVNAQEEVKERKFNLSGSVDAYYQTNLNASDAEGSSFGTSFADQTGFALGMANVVLSYESGAVGAVADLAFGPRGFSAVGGGDGLFINQLYAYWNVSEKVKFTAGRFNTYLGYEVISPVGNFNYSTSYLFSSGPFSHVGLKADIALSEDFSLMLAFMNVTDVNSNLTGAYSAGAQLGYKGQYLNLYYDGGEALGFEIDYTGGFDLTDSFFLGINAAYADNEGNGFYGVALYPQLATSEKFTIGLRSEYFARFDENLDDVDEIAFTLTGSYSVGDLTIKPELRFDTEGEQIRPFDTAVGSDNLSTFLVAAIYSF